MKSFQFVLVLLAFVFSPLLSQGTGITLTGINSIQVVVQPIPSDISTKGFFQSDFQSDIELRCRTIGIKVLDSSDTQLVLAIAAQKATSIEGYQNQTWFIFTVNLAVLDVVQLNRPSQVWISNIPIWQEGFFGILSESKIREIKERVSSLYQILE